MDTDFLADLISPTLTPSSIFNLVTLSGTYYCPTKVERRTMQRVVAAIETGDYSIDPETIYRQEVFRERFLSKPN